MKYSRLLSLLFGLSAASAQADMGPALSGLTARAGDATSVFWSPAAITRLEQPELLVGATLAVTESKFEVDQSNRSGGDADNDVTVLAIPSVYYTQPLGERWHVGASLTVPSGFGNEYGKSWSGRYLAESSDLAFVALAGTVAYELTDQWSVGGGPILLYTDSETRARINNFSGPDGRIKLEEDGIGVSWQLGLMYEPSERTRFAAVYRAETDPDLSGKPELQNLDPLLQAGLDALNLLDEDIDVDFKVPEQVQLGYYQALDNKWSFTLDAMWINMSKFGVTQVSVSTDQVSFNGDFKDNWLFSAGLRYQHRPDLAFSAGALYMTTPASDGRRTIALPVDRVYAFGAGVEWEWQGFEIHNALTYADLGDGSLDQDGGLPGRIKGSFDTNYAVVFDTQLIRRF